MYLKRPARLINGAPNDPERPLLGKYVEIIPSTELLDGFPAHLKVRATPLGRQRIKRQLQAWRTRNFGAFGTYSNWYEAFERLFWDLERRRVACCCHQFYQHMTDNPIILLDGDWGYNDAESSFCGGRGGPWRVMSHRGNRPAYWFPNAATEEYLEPLGRGEAVTFESGGFGKKEE